MRSELVCLFLLAFALPARAQMLQGSWVEASQKAIETHRKTDLRVLVLDRHGRPVPWVRVRVEQRRHGFAWGYAPAADAPVGVPAELADAAVWRCFNAIALDRRTEPLSEVLHPQGDGEPPLMQQEPSGGDAAGFAAPIHTRWGTVLSADAGRLPAASAAMRGPSLADHLIERVRTIVRNRGATQFDLYAHCIDYAFVEERLGGAMLRRLFEEAKAARPEATLCVRFDDAWDGGRLRTMTRKLTAFREAFVPIDAVALETRFTGTVVQAPLLRSLEWVTQHELPVMICELEVGGPSAAAAAINMETVLRTLFAEPAIQGIWLAGLRDEELSDPAAALLDDQGEPTPAGEVFDKLVRGLWWTDEERETDALGNVRTRVFAGLYRLSVALPDGSMAETHVLLDAAAPERLVVLQPIKADTAVSPAATPVVAPAAAAVDAIAGAESALD